MEYATDTLTESDLELLRAQLANCVIMAISAINQDNPHLNAQLLLSRFNKLSLMFTLTLEHEARVYFIRLLDPDGSRVSFMRAGNKGAKIELDDLDTVVIEALKYFMECTVTRAWNEEHVALPSPTVTPEVYSLH